MIKDNHVAASREFSAICKILEREYGSPDPLKPPLGNLLEPMDELVYILLTTMTEFGAIDVFNKLKVHYASWGEILEKSPEVLYYFLRPLGLSKQKGDRLISILKEIFSTFGYVALKQLKEIPEEEMEVFLCSLPGIGKKTARCIMMYSLDKKVFPVDTHVLRLCKRMGLLESSVSWQKAHDILQNAVLPMDRYSLHVNLVLHGRKICKAKKPVCQECRLALSCKSCFFG
ncbi:MAG: hypothetical protein FIA99_00820 [Ruminiclostridium sp.]|nr:hypothetical protein [Ruminiclostridium sp.]